MNPFDLLPNEIVEQIFDNLEVVNLNRISQLCNRFYIICFEKLKLKLEKQVDILLERIRKITELKYTDRFDSIRFHKKTSTGKDVHLKIQPPFYTLSNHIEIIQKDMDINEPFPLKDFDVLYKNSILVRQKHFKFDDKGQYLTKIMAKFIIQNKYIEDILVENNDKIY